MTLTGIAARASVFVDANTLVYYFVPHPTFGPPCKQFVERITRQEIIAFTSTHVMSDVAHRIMTMEAIGKFGWPVKGIAQRLKQHPAEVQTLLDFRQAVDSVPKLGIQVLAIPPQLISVATIASQKYGLLSGDALVVAIMQANGLSNLASHDADFDRVPGLLRFAPV
jgi:predicted nucleic acid-binding protein